LPRGKARKPVDVPELFNFCHILFIALFSGLLQRLNPLLDRDFKGFWAHFYPLVWEKTQKYFQGSFAGKIFYGVIELQD
jgi:hypothetical protein